MAKSTGSEPTILYTPDGREYATSDRVEVTRLKAHGYSETKPKSGAKAKASAKRAPATKAPANKAAASPSSGKATDDGPSTVDAPKS